MNRFLLLSVFTLLGLFPCKSQDVIVLHKENKLTGRVLWEKSKGDSLFYRSAVSSGDSLLLFVPRRRVEYVLSDGDRRMLYRGKTRGWQPWRGRTFNEVPQHRMLYGVSGGIITDGEQNAVDANYEPIPGLYMAGNDCGRRFGTEYVTPIPGCSLAFALVLGRECGKSVAKFLG